MNRLQDRAVTIIESDPDIAYVAISHVWTDGLGNVQRNALPRCQMLRLNELIRSLPGCAPNSTLFWIDTIGRPPDAAGRNEAQGLAVGVTRRTYGDAYAVLVLDSWLRSLTVGGLSDAEILLRIVCSAWNSRPWILQEDALAKTLFQFADAQYNLDEGMQRLHEADDVLMDIKLSPAISHRIYEFRGFRHIEDTMEAKTKALAAAVRFRSTSVASDEPLCPVAPLDLDVMQIVQSSRHERMLKFWSLVKTVPESILISCDCLRLETGGYR